jgi:PPOX class probable F420-dependent enzyme
VSRSPARIEPSSWCADRDDLETDPIIVGSGSIAGGGLETLSDSLQHGTMNPYSVPSSHHDLVTAATVALSTLNDDGSIQTTAVWMMLDDGVLRTSLSKNRQKYRNMLARPTATIFSISPSNPFHTLEVRATVEIADDDAERTFMAKLVGTYGQSLESMAEQAQEDRAVITFHPTRVRAD